MPSHFHRESGRSTESIADDAEMQRILESIKPAIQEAVREWINANGTDFKLTKKNMDMLDSFIQSLSVKTNLGRLKNIKRISDFVLLELTNKLTHPFGIEEEAILTGKLIGKFGPEKNI